MGLQPNRQAPLTSFSEITAGPRLSEPISAHQPSHPAPHTVYPSGLPYYPPEAHQTLSYATGPVGHRDDSPPDVVSAARACLLAGYQQAG